MKESIIFEANCAEALIYDIYIGRELMDTKNYIHLKKRMQAIRDGARKEDDPKTHP